MTPEQTELFKILGISAIFLLQLRQIYYDGREDRAKMLAMLAEIQPDLVTVKERLAALETRLDIFDPPTHPTRLAASPSP